MTLKIIIPGRPTPKKNSPRIIPARGNRPPMLLPAQSWYEFIKRCEPHILPHGNIQFDTPVQVCVNVWLQDARKPDLVNVLQGVGDMLEHFKLLTNDRLIESWNGSRICGIDRPNPRTEITITIMDKTKPPG